MFRTCQVGNTCVKMIVINASIDTNGAFSDYMNKYVTKALQ